MRLALAVGCAVSALLAVNAVAQTAAAPPSGPAAAPAAADPAAAPARAAGKPKKRGPTPASAVIVTNASANTATEVVISADDKPKTSKPLRPKAKVTVKLPRLKGCMVSVAATFEGEGQADVGEFDVCKDKNIR